MDSYWLQAVVTAKAGAVGGLLALDGQSCLHLVASQPLVSGVLAGWLFGDAWLGLTVGAYLQLMWAYGPPPRRSPGPDTASGAVVGVAVAYVFSPVAAAGYAHIALGFAVAVAIAWAGRHTEVARRRVNGYLAERALGRLRDGDPGALARAHAAALALAGMRGALVCGAGCAAGLALGRVGINYLAVMDFGPAFALIPCVGVASFFLGIVKAERKGLAFFAAGVAVALLARFTVPFP